MARFHLPLIAAAIALAVILLLDDVLIPAVWGVGFPVCHQLPEHSLFAGGLQYPLCARCTGIYLGFLTGVAGLAIQGRLRAGRLPSGGTLAVLFLAIGLMAADGFNSLLGASGDSRLLYETTNLLRITTGLSAGVALSLLLVPMLNDSLWNRTNALKSADVPSDLLGYAVLAAMAGLVAYSQRPALYYPIALLSGLGIASLLSTAGAILATSLLRVERRATTIREAARPVVAGVALAAVTAGLLGFVRAQFSLALGI